MTNDIDKSSGTANVMSGIAGTPVAFAIRAVKLLNVWMYVGSQIHWYEYSRQKAAAVFAVAAFFLCFIKNLPPFYKTIANDAII